MVAGILVLSWTAVIWQARLVSELHRENRTLRGQMKAQDEAAKRAAGNTQASHDEEVGRLRAEAQEVHKLRGEVSRLRAQTNELERIRAENQRLKSASLLSGSAVIQNSQQPDYFAKENWAFAGYAAPEAALQSSHWAMRGGDWKTVKASTTAEGWARLGKGPENERFAAEIEEERKRNVRDTAGFPILERKAVSEEEVVLRVHVDGQGSNAGDQNIVLKRWNGDWKVDRAYRDPPVPAVNSPDR